MSFRLSIVDSIDRRPGSPKEFLLNTSRINRVNEFTTGVYEIQYATHLKTQRGESVLVTQDPYYGASVKESSNSGARITIPVTSINNQIVTEDVTIVVSHVIYAIEKFGSTMIYYEDSNNRLREFGTEISMSDLEQMLNYVNNSLVFDLYPPDYAYVPFVGSSSQGKQIGVVTRSSDSETTPLNHVNGIIDKESVETFLGASDGTLESLFASGVNKDALEQLTVGFQPKIANAGSLIVNSAGTIYAEYDGVDDRMIANLDADLRTNPATVFQMYRNPSVALTGTVGGPTSGANRAGVLFVSAGLVLYQTGPAVSEPSTLTTDTPYIDAYRTSTDGFNYERWVNGVEVPNLGTQDIGTQTPTSVYVGGRGNNSSFSNVGYFGIVGYMGDNMGDRPAIEILLNKYIQAI